MGHSHSTTPEKTVRMRTNSPEVPFPMHALDKMKHAQRDCHGERTRYAYKCVRKYLP
jgi:hypothetical protein